MKGYVIMNKCLGFTKKSPEPNKKVYRFNDIIFLLFDDGFITKINVDFKFGNEYEIQQNEWKSELNYLLRKKKFERICNNE